MNLEDQKGRIWKCKEWIWKAGKEEFENKNNEFGRA